MAYKLVSWLQTVEYLLLPQVVIGDFKVMVTGSVFEFPSLIDSWKIIQSKTLPHKSYCLFLFTIF